MRTVLFGGSFDPVHNGHVAAVRLLRARYERVIVIPAFVSPFKSGARAGDADRLAMLKLALAGTDGVETSDYELDKGGVSYTYQTLRAYPGAAFALGGDSMNTLSEWAHADELVNREIALIDRPGIDCRPARAAWEAAGGRIVCVGEAPEVSSTLARWQISLGRPALVPPAVRRYAERRGLYPEWRELAALYPRFHLKASRIEHTYRVAETACRLAERHGVDAEKALRAAMLHDLAKYLSIEEAEAMGARVGAAARTALGAVRHAILGADVAESLLGEDAEIVEAIRRHTTGRAGMSRLAAVVALADYIEPGRDFPGVEAVRERAWRDLDGAVAMMLGATVEHLRAKGARIDPETIAARDYYQNLIRR